MTGRRVVVVGGGIAGLAAAHELAGLGAAVTVLEASERLGGKIRTSRFAGRNVDEGADAFLLRVRWGLETCQALGHADELVHPAARTAYVWGHGALRPLPPQHMGIPTDLDALAASGLVSDAAVERVRADLARTGPATGTTPGDGTIADAVAARLGWEIVERMVDPLVGGINAGDTRALSMDAVVPQIAAAMRDPEHASLVQACLAQQARSTADAAAPIFAGPRNGMGDLVTWLVDAIAAAGVVVRSGAAAGPIEPAGTGWRVPVDGSAPLEADAVIVTLPAHAMPAVLAGWPGPAAVLGAVDHASVAMVTMAFRPEDLGHPLDRSGFLVPRVEPTKALSACSWASTKWAHLAPDHGDGTHVLRASAGRAGAEAALDLDDADLVAALVDDLAVTMGVRGGPTEVRVTRWLDSLPQYRPGHLERIDAVEAALPPTVALAGAALRGVGVPACINSGRQAARAVLAALTP